MSCTRARLAGLILACAVAAGLTLAAPASAAGHPTSTAGLHPNAVPALNYGAGYFTYPGSAHGVASASATFTMPSFSCVHAGDHEWLLPGIWVYDGNGNMTQQVDVNFNCNLGAILQQSVICLTGASCDTSLAPAPGDTIVASLAYTSTATVGTIKDVTTGQQAQVVGPAVTTDYTVFVGDLGPNPYGVTKVPSFTKVPFTSVQVNGQRLVDSSAVQYNLKTGNVVQITSTKILPDGQSFTTYFKHS